MQLDPGGCPVLVMLEAIPVFEHKNRHVLGCLRGTETSFPFHVPYLLRRSLAYKFHHRQEVNTCDFWVGGYHHAAVTNVDPLL